MSANKSNFEIYHLPCANEVDDHVLVAKRFLELLTEFGRVPRILPIDELLIVTCSGGGLLSRWLGCLARGSLIRLVRFSPLTSCVCNVQLVGTVETEMSKRKYTCKSVYSQRDLVVVSLVQQPDLAMLSIRVILYRD